MEDLGRCEHLSDAMILPRHITHEGASLQGCDSFILVADADQSRLLVSHFPITPHHIGSETK
jgi:hypothetical protein